jgi:hypothetical protein
MERLILELSANGAYSAVINGRRETVLLLQHRSFWGAQIAGVTLSTEAGESFTAWFIAQYQDSDAWRRFWVRFRFP